MQILEAVLIESKSARDTQLSALSEERALKILGRVKAIIFALSRQGEKLATVEQIADYYQISIDTVKKVYQRHKDEFESDGVRVWVGDELKLVKDILSLTSTTPSAIVWTPRGTVRLGMLLKASEVAKRLRTTLLDLTERVVAHAVLEDSSELVPIERSPLELARTTAVGLREIYDATNPINPALAEALIGFALRDFNAQGVLMPTRIAQPEMIGCTEFAQRMGYHSESANASLGKCVARAWRESYGTEPAQVYYEYPNYPEPLPLKLYPWGDPVIRLAIKEFFKNFS